MFSLYVHTQALTAGDKQTSVGQICSPHGPRLIWVSGHNGRNSVWSHITHIKQVKLGVCVSWFMTQDYFCHQVLGN